ncbi:multiheme c-type cytochrome [Pyrolobus fumarii]|nr:multiheme c-type cytochrome [Pyrolobus fumarii]
MSRVVTLVFVVSILALLAVSATAAAATVPFGDEVVKKVDELLKSDIVSPQTKACIQCHLSVTPMIVYEWAMSKHAQMTPAQVAELYKKLGEPQWANMIAEKFKNYKYVVGCYECHGMFADTDRPDAVEHIPGVKIVAVVTRKDCGQCHPKENIEISWTWHATAAFAPIKPWYTAIIKYAVSEGANPFGDENAKALYEKYLPPFLTKQRDKEPVYWNFYKEIAKAVMEYMMTGKENDIVKMLKEATGMVTPYDLDWKKWISPLWPASGVLNNTILGKLGIKITIAAMDGTVATVSNVMSHPTFRNAYVYHACLECHGAAVIPYGYAEDPTYKVKIVKLWGWPNNGAGRIDPDGSIGTCTACHPRHMFSVKQAREPWTCGQCHLGYDHPHIEIYEESKHGNIYDAYGEEWNWEQIPWRPGIDFNAPTCATCHMSALADKDGNIIVPGTHDLVKRLVWDQMHFFSHPKPVIPDNFQTATFLKFSMLKGKYPEDVMKAYEQTGRYPVFMGLKIVDECQPGQVCFPRLPKVELTGELAKHREEMKKVCRFCHASQWVDNYFRTADQNIIEYDIVARFAFSLLQLAWAEGIHDKKNLLDEYMEIMWYYIWHHDGRRWRNGATMMGPDYAHWLGIVDTVMDKLGRMINYLATALKVKKLETELAALKQQAAGAPYAPELVEKIAKLERMIEELKSKLAALEAQVPTLKAKLTELSSDVSALESDYTSFKGDVSEIVKRVEELSKQLETIAPEAKKITELVSQVKDIVAKLETLNKKVEEVSGKVEKMGEEVGTVKSKVEKVSEEVSSVTEQLGAVSANSYTLAGIALAVAAIALGLAVIRGRGA